MEGTVIFQNTDKKQTATAKDKSAAAAFLLPLYGRHTLYLILIIKQNIEESKLAS